MMHGVAWIGTVVVVESPAECATISKFLGPNYAVLSCYGHVRALPSKPGSVRPDEGFAMTFEDSIQPRVLNPLRNALRDRRGVEASRLLLATDPDCAAIGKWHGKSAAQVALRWIVQRNATLCGHYAACPPEVPRPR